MGNFPGTTRVKGFIGSQWRSNVNVVVHSLVLTHTHQFNGPFPGLPGWAGTRKVKPIWILLARDSEWQWHQLGHMQVCTSLQTDNYSSNPPLSFLQAGCPSCRPTNSVKALKGSLVLNYNKICSGITCKNGTYGMPTFSKLVPILFQSDIVLKQYSVVPRQTAQFPEML